MVKKRYNHLEHRHTINHLETTKHDVVVIQYTVHPRIEYFNDKTNMIENWTPQRANDTQRCRAYYLSVYNDTLAAENMWKNILLFDAYCKANDIKFIPLLADHYAEPIRRPEKFYRVGHTGWWKPLCEGIPVVRIHEGILKESPSPMFLPKNHPSSLGHKEIANKVIELIEAI